MPLIVMLSFFFIKVLKDCSANNNLYLLSSFFVAPPIAISVLANCEQNLQQFYCSILPTIE